MKKNRIRKDDNVLVTSGNSRGKTGKVIRISGVKVVIEGVNMRRKHVKPTRTSKGGIIDMEMPVHISNVQVCVNGNQPVKLHARKNNDGQRELFYKEGSNEVTYRTLSPKN